MRIRITIAWAILATTIACAKDPKVVPADAVPVLSRDPAVARGCGRVEDCVVSELIDGSCCRDQCGAQHIYNRNYEKRLRDHLESACKERRCGTIARCPGDGLTAVTAYCAGGYCGVSAR